MKKLTPKKLQRFQSRLRKEESGCWVWTGRLDRHGYGRVTVYDAQQYTHRIAYEHWVGPIPEGHYVHHTCENPACANPEHLQLITPERHNQIFHRRP